MKHQKYQILNAVESDAGSIVKIIQSGFSPEVLKLIIYGCNGITQYVKNQIRARDFGADTQYTVAKINNKIVGVVELRKMNETLFLNYIVIANGFQRQGLAQILLQRGIEMAEGLRYREFALDVFDYNDIAIKWYERLGLIQKYSANWFEVQNSTMTESEKVIVIGFPVAEISQKIFNFSQFDIVTEKGQYKVGRLDNNWFRITEPKGLDDKDFLGVLHKVDKNRKLMVLIVDNAKKPKMCQKKLLTTIRMSGDFNTVIKNIKLKNEKK